jgi:hypothetical protein
MENDTKLNVKVDYEILYNQAMRDFKIYTLRLKYIEKEFARAKKEIQTLQTSGRVFLGMDKYVENTIMKQFYDVKDYIFTVRKDIKQKQGKLKNYFLANRESGVSFGYEAKALEIIMSEKEAVVDMELDKCIDYLKLYNPKDSIEEVL